MIFLIDVGVVIKLILYTAFFPVSLEGTDNQENTILSRMN